MRTCVFAFDILMLQMNPVQASASTAHWMDWCFGCSSLGACDAHGAVTPSQSKQPLGSNLLNRNPMQGDLLTTQLSEQGQVNGSGTLLWFLLALFFVASHVAHTLGRSFFFARPWLPAPAALPAGAVPTQLRSASTFRFSAPSRRDGRSFRAWSRNQQQTGSPRLHARTNVFFWFYRRLAWQLIKHAHSSAPRSQNLSLVQMPLLDGQEGDL